MCEQRIGVTKRAGMTETSVKFGSKYGFIAGVSATSVDPVTFGIISDEGDTVQIMAILSWSFMQEEVIPGSKR